MALTASELSRIRYEMGFNLLDAGADVYVGGITAFFELVLKPYLTSGAITTSSTIVPEPGPLPTAVVLTLTSITNFNVGDSVVVDVDALAESATVQSLTGSTITVLLLKPHTGSYPVQNLTTAVTTSSSTVVPSLIAPPRSVDLILASATGFTVGNTIVIDSDARQETATVTAINSNTVTVYLNKGHTGTYPVTVEGGESILRAILQQIQIIAPLGGQYGGRSSGSLQDAADAAGVKKVDEIEFFGPTAGVNGASAANGNPIQQQMFLLEYWRDQLSYAIGLPRKNKKRGSSAYSY